MHILNLGAGVQSSTMALMAAAREIKPMPDAAIFADVGWEPAEVYEWLDWLETQLPFSLYRTSRDSERWKDKTLRDEVMMSTMDRWAPGRDYGKTPAMPIPAFTMSDGNVGIIQRHCTRDWKIRPIDKLSKRLAGLKPRAKLPTEPVVTSWIGISLDEIVRAKPARPEDKWKLHRFPLAFEKQMRRSDCIAWMKAHGYPEPPRSACIGCPFHDDYEWWRIKQDPRQWADAVEVDEKIRTTGGMRGQVFLHSSGRPLTQAVPDKEPPRKAENPINMQLFNECEGMCGV